MEVLKSSTIIGLKGSSEIKVVIGMALVLLVPLTLTLLSITQPPVPLPTPPLAAENSIPFGYARYLLLFAVPDLVLGWWLLTVHRCRREKIAFCITVGMLVPLWCLLDILLGPTFFKFPRADASVGTFWMIGFYALGLVAILLVYIWGDEYWFAAYKRNSALGPSGTSRQFFRPHLGSGVAGVVLFGMSWAYKKFGPHPYNEGIPGYFLFLLLLCILASLLFYRMAEPSINWRAFGFVFLLTVLVGVAWEATEVFSYQLRQYNRSQMMGLFIGAHAGLPVEAVMFWAFASWTTVIVYRAVHILLDASAVLMALAEPADSLLRKDHTQSDAMMISAGFRPGSITSAAAAQRDL